MFLFMLNIRVANMNESGGKRWRKILYEDQGVPDNYVDESFLDEMRKNCTWGTLECLKDYLCCWIVRLFYSEPRPLRFTLIIVV